MHLAPSAARGGIFPQYTSILYFVLLSRTEIIYFQAIQLGKHGMYTSHSFPLTHKAGAQVCIWV